MIAILYHWRIVDGMRGQFEDAWSTITQGLKHQGALGSALFDAEDGTVFALARWPDRATRAASSARRAHPEAYESMVACIAEEWPEQILDEALNFWDDPYADRRR